MSLIQGVREKKKRKEKEMMLFVGCQAVLCG
jgi:hypothetical protein